MVRISSKLTSKRIVRVSEKDRIGRGAFARIYRISPRRIVKVFYDTSAWYNNDHKYHDHLIRREYRGAKKYKKINALPCLGIITVYETISGVTTKKKGIVKEYIPLPVTTREMCKLYKAEEHDYFWDLHRSNVRKKPNGTIYIIDTDDGDDEHD